jgi:hypothetical protein
MFKKHGILFLIIPLNQRNRKSLSALPFGRATIFSILLINLIHRKIGNSQINIIIIMVWHSWSALIGHFTSNTGRQ